MSFDNSNSDGPGFVVDFPFPRPHRAQGLFKLASTTMLLDIILDPYVCGLHFCLPLYSEASTIYIANLSAGLSKTLVTCLMNVLVSLCVQAFVGD